MELELDVRVNDPPASPVARRHVPHQAPHDVEEGGGRVGVVERPRVPRAELGAVVVAEVGVEAGRRGLEKEEAC